METRARLFDAAVAEIGRSGLAGADVSTIVAATGVARGTFYFHFPTKEHVVVEAERAEEAKIVARLATRRPDRKDLFSMLSLLVREVLGAERRLGPVFFRDMLGLHFSSTRPVEDELSAHPLAEFVIAAIAEAPRRGTGRSMQTRVNSGCSFSPGCSRCSPPIRARLGPCGTHGPIREDDRSRNGDTMNANGIDGYRVTWNAATAKPTC